MIEYTIVTGLININREGWTNPFKRDWSKYLDSFERGVLRVQAPMVIFVEENLVEWVKEKRKDYPQTVIKVISFEVDYMLHPLLNRIRNIQNSPGYKRLIAQGNIENCPEVSVAEYPAVVNNKMEFLRRASESNPFNTHYFVWVDAGVGHNQINVPRKSKWDISGLIRMAIPDKFVVMGLNDQLTYDDPTRFFVEHKDLIAGTIMIGTKKSIEKVHSLLYPYILELLNKGLIDDDQFYITLLVQKYPDLFSIVQTGGWDFIEKILLRKFPVIMVATILCGNVRTYKDCKGKEWLKLHDLFISTYREKYNFHPYNQEKYNFYDEEEVKEEDFKDLPYLGLVWNDDHKKNKDMIISTFDPVMKEINHGWFQYDCFEKGLELMREYEKAHHFKYDIIIKTRFDLDYPDNFPTIFDDDLGRKIYINSEGVRPSDFIFIGSRDLIDQIPKGLMKEYFKPSSEICLDTPPHGILRHYLSDKKFDAIPLGIIHNVEKKPEKYKIALLISGEMRGCTNLPHFEGNHDVDIFVSTWRQLGEEKMYPNAKSVVIEQPRLETFQKLFPSDVWKKYPGLSNENTTSRACSGLYKMYSAKESFLSYSSLFKEKYDIVVRWRPDLILNQLITDIQLRDSLRSKCIYMPEWHGKYESVMYKVMDHFFFGPPELMIEVCDVYKHLEEYIKDTSFAHTFEGFLYQSLKKVSVKRFRLSYDVQRQGRIEVVHE